MHNLLIQVRNESAEDFLCLLKEWDKLCASYLSTTESNDSTHKDTMCEDKEEDEGGSDTKEDGNDGDDGEIYEVAEILTICYGDPNEIKKPALYFKVPRSTLGKTFV